MKIPVSHGHLEAALRNPQGAVRGGALVCHPHPLQGGTMHTKAVYRAGQAFLEAGFRTLRFNFRGVGCSTGSYDGGVGEMEDVRAALDWLRLGLGDLPLVCAGVSFGSMIGLSVGVEDPRVKALVGVGVPIHSYDFSFLASPAKPVLIVQGEHDVFGSGGEVAEYMGALGSHVTVVVVEGAGHLFDGHFPELRAAIRDYFTAGPGRTALSREAVAWRAEESG